MVGIDEPVYDCLNKMREYYSDDEGKPASFTVVIRKALKKANLWQKCNKSKKHQ